jgi:hypothetical protein
MKKILSFTLIISFLIYFSASAQNKKVEFHSINQFAIVGGESQMNSAFQTVNGAKFFDWFTGIGIGIDNYRYKTLPLFIDGRWFFGDDKNGFVYGDIGYNFPMKNKPGKEISYYSSYHFTEGVYTDIGIGYKAPLYKKSSLLFSLGYSYKELQTKIGVNACGIIGPCWVDYSKYNFSYSRMILKAGFVF